MLGKALFQIVLATVVISPASANRGHWRGESGNSVSSTAQPPTIWSPTENIKWRVAVPSRGSGSPVIWDKRVILKERSLFSSRVRVVNLASTSPRTNTKRDHCLRDF